MSSVAHMNSDVKCLVMVRALTKRYTDTMKTIMGKCAWGIIGATWSVALFVYGSMPQQMATHWNAIGIADGYTSKTVGLFLIPAIMVLLQVIFMILPSIDPLKDAIQRIGRRYEQFALLFAMFMGYLFCLSIAWNIGMVFAMNRWLSPAFGGLFYGIGAGLKDIERNWFIGIRTPWTLSSDDVWNKTHAIGSTVFKVIGLIALFGMIVPQYAIALMIIPALGGSVGMVIYSYWICKMQK